jgi:hypothetical protein
MHRQKAHLLKKTAMGNTRKKRLPPALALPPHNLQIAIQRKEEQKLNSLALIWI